MRVWTEEQDALLRNLHDTMSFSLITASINGQFGTTYSRNAVIGRAHRLDLITKKPQPVAVMQPVRRSDRNNGPLVQRLRRARKGKEPKISESAFEPRVVDIVSLRLSILEVGEMQCRWADDEPHPESGWHTFCGNRTEDGSSYCPAHAALNRGLGTRSERDAIGHAKYAAKVAA